VAEALNHTLVHRALALEGTCTGEHGVGLHKMDFLRHEAGDGASGHDAHHQACAGPGQHPEPGQDLRRLKRPARRTTSSDPISGSWLVACTKASI
jgi:FAD/FMN-containing dehydrogenase